MIINKIIFNYQDPDNMEEVNKITGLNAFAEINCCDYSEFEEYPELAKFVSNEELEVLANGEAEYIAFRLDY